MSNAEDEASTSSSSIEVVDGGIRKAISSLFGGQRGDAGTSVEDVVQLILSDGGREEADELVRDGWSGPDISSLSTPPSIRRAVLLHSALFVNCTSSEGSTTRAAFSLARAICFLLASRLEARAKSRPKGLQAERLQNPPSPTLAAGATFRLLMEVGDLCASTTGREKAIAAFSTVATGNEDRIVPPALSLVVILGGNPEALRPTLGKVLVRRTSSEEVVAALLRPALEKLGVEQDTVKSLAKKEAGLRWAIQAIVPTSKVGGNDTPPARLLGMLAASGQVDIIAIAAIQRIGDIRDMEREDTIRYVREVELAADQATEVAGALVKALPKEKGEKIRHAMYAALGHLLLNVNDDKLVGQAGMVVCSSIIDVGTNPTPLVPVAPKKTLGASKASARGGGKGGTGKKKKADIDEMLLLGLSAKPTKKKGGTAGAKKASTSTSKASSLTNTSSSPPPDTSVQLRTLLDMLSQKQELIIRLIPSAAKTGLSVLASTPSSKTHSTTQSCTDGAAASALLLALGESSDAPPPSYVYGAALVNAPGVPMTVGRYSSIVEDPATYLKGAAGGALCRAALSTHQQTRDAAFWALDTIFKFSTVDTLQVLTDVLYEVACGAAKDLEMDAKKEISDKVRREALDRKNLICSGVSGAGFMILKRALFQGGQDDVGKALILSCVGGEIPEFLKEHVETFSTEATASTIIEIATDGALPDTIAKASLKVLLELCGLAEEELDKLLEDEDYDGEDDGPLRAWILEHMGAALSNVLIKCVENVEIISKEDVHVYRHEPGQLYRGTTAVSNAQVKSNKNLQKKRVARGTRKGDFGAGAEEEEWERQLREEMEQKKREVTGSSASAGASSPAPVELTKEEKTQLHQQTVRREQITILLSTMRRSASAATALCSKDVEIGNACLLVVAPPLIQLMVSACPAASILHLSDLAEHTLVQVAAGAYELPEECHVHIAKSLHWSSGADTNAIAPMSAVLEDMEGCGTDGLSVNTFKFLWPILRRALSGDRTLPGTENIINIVALNLSSVASMRREVSNSLLEFLGTDRRRSAVPNPAQVLANLYTIENVSSHDLAILLGDMGCTHSVSAVRAAAMGALGAVMDLRLGLHPLLEGRVWAAMHDEDTKVMTEAKTTWQKLGGGPPGKMYAMTLLPLLGHKEGEVAAAAAKAVAVATQMLPDTASQTMKRLCDIYLNAFPSIIEERKKKKTQEQLLKEQFMGKKKETEKKGGEDGKDSDTKIRTRKGICACLSALADPHHTIDFTHYDILTILATLTAHGLADPHEATRALSVSAARDIVERFGSENAILEVLLPQLETVLQTGLADGEKAPRSIAATDARKTGAVILLGSAALHLVDDVEGINRSVDMLLGALATPSETVQHNVATCLSKLMKKGCTPSRTETIVGSLLDKTLNGKSLALRRGSAYGLSAAIQGGGVSSLKKFGVVAGLDEALNSPQSSWQKKEGALFAIELFSGRLKLLFEPYVIGLLPSLLKAFSDGNNHVRTAASDTAGVLMAKLSTHGVKLILPAILGAFDDPSWRTKAASIYMLGSMSKCAPKQLGSCLPRVVPKLVEATSDTHPKVKGAAEEALETISGVVRNPEIASMGKVLFEALKDPTGSTKTALEGLLATEFVHAIDPPGLALLMPILIRGLRDRSAVNKRYAALITGNMCTMIDDPKRDFKPYLPNLMPGLKAAVVDPIPDVRTTAAKSLGSLTRGLGQDALLDLRPWLVDTLQSELGTAVERSGAAQGLTEVLIASGTDVIENVMVQEILPLRKHPKAVTREGVMWVLTFMPSSLGQAFAPLIAAALPALVGGLSDSKESVREVALRAGKVIIRTVGRSHVDLILPCLEDGLVDENWRIRVSSLTLLGDLLSMIGGGVNGRGVSEEDDARQAERVQAQIALVLGAEKRQRVLSSLYMSRSDNSAEVRHNAVQVWKSIVSVTPRTIREILGIIVLQIVSSLASGNADRIEVGSCCLGEIVRKLGDAVLPEVIPILRDELQDRDQDKRRGVCVGLAEMIRQASKEQTVKYLEVLSKAVRDALCDDVESVRRMAAECFQSLYNVVGSRALDEVVPTLLVQMENAYDEFLKARALNGLTEILRVRSRELLPYLVPKLIASPMTVHHANALGSIAAVTGGSLHMHYNVLIPALIRELGCFALKPEEEEIKREEAVRACARSVCRFVDTAGLSLLCFEIANKCVHDKPSIRRESCWMFGVIPEERKEIQDFYEQIPIFFRELLHRMNDDNSEVLLAANKSLKSLSSHVPADELLHNLEFCRNLIASMVSDSRRRKGGVGDGEFLMPGFNIKNGLEPLIPIYQRGILYGNSNIREVAASGLGELLVITSPKFLAGPFIIKMTGPLLRIVGDRNPSGVKVAIIKTLGLILIKGGPALRAFVPQFQTTFVKALSDPTRQVRVESTKALALLMPLSLRLDPLIKELVGGSMGNSSANSMIESAGSTAVQTATLDALAVVLKNGGKKARIPGSLTSSLSTGRDLIVHEDEGIRECAAKVVGAACGVMGIEKSLPIIEDILTESNDNTDAKHGRACAIFQICESVGPLLGNEMHAMILSALKPLLIDENNLVREASATAGGCFLGCVPDALLHMKDLEQLLLRLMNSKEDISVHRGIARGLCYAVVKNPDLFLGKSGVTIISAGQKLAMSSIQKVQLPFNDFLWLAFKVKEGNDVALQDYLNNADDEQSRSMKSLHTKVLVKMKKLGCFDELQL